MKMTLVRRLGLALFLLSTTFSSAAQAERIALLIGNKNYAPGVGPLRNPHRDVELLAGVLKDLDFEVLPLIFEADRNAIISAVSKLADRLKIAGPDSVALFYYSGHGASLSSGSDNYLIPIGIQQMSSESLRAEGVKLDELVDILDAEAPDAAKFVLFDACRSELRGWRGVKGFKPVKQVGGTWVGFASAPGTAAYDGAEANSPYALALAKHLPTPAADHIAILSQVRDDVVLATKGEQVPWNNDGLPLRRVRFLEDKRVASAWFSAKAQPTPDKLADFAARYRGTPEAIEADQMLEKARQAAIRSARNSLKSRQKLQSDNTNSAVADLTKYGSGSKEFTLAWRVLISDAVVFVDAVSNQVLEILDVRGQGSQAYHRPYTGPDIIVREVPNAAALRLGPETGSIVIDEKFGVFDARLSRASEHTYSNLRGALDYLHFRLGYRDLYKRDDLTFEDITVYVVPNLNSFYYCPAASAQCPKAKSIVAGADMAKSPESISRPIWQRLMNQEADLVYFGESGAISSAISEFLSIAFASARYADRGGWIFEEGGPSVSGSSPWKQFRDPTLGMFNKSLAYSQSNRGRPDHYDAFVIKVDPICETTSDYFVDCLHFNSGIITKAMYLLMEGGTHHDVEVPKLGVDLLVKIMMRAIRSHMHPAMKFQEFASALIRSCREFSEVGQIRSEDCTKVALSFSAVGIAQSRVSINDQSYQNSISTTVAKITQSAAIATAQSHIGAALQKMGRSMTAEDFNAATTTASLVVFDPALLTNAPGPSKLCWLVEIVGHKVFVDSIDGGVVFFLPSP